MRAAFYQRTGAACDVLQTGEAPQAFFVDDNHFSAAGSTLVASQIAQFLETSELLGK